MFHNPQSFLYRAVSVIHLVTGLLIVGILASPVTRASGEEGYAVQDAEAPDVTLGAEAPDVTQGAGDPDVTQGAEAPDGTQGAEDPDEVQ